MTRFSPKSNPVNKERKNYSPHCPICKTKITPSPAEIKLLRAGASLNRFCLWCGTSLNLLMPEMLISTAHQVTAIGGSRWFDAVDLGDIKYKDVPERINRLYKKSEWRLIARRCKQALKNRLFSLDATELARELGVPTAWVMRSADGSRWASVGPQLDSQKAELGLSLPQIRVDNFRLGPKINRLLNRELRRALKDAGQGRRIDATYARGTGDSES